MIRVKYFQFIRTALGVGVFFAVFGAHAWAAQFTVLSDTSVQDSTGLMWAPDANTPGYGSCAGGKKNWQATVDYVSCLNSNNYLGHSDWRMPTGQELASLARGGRDPAGIAGSLNKNGFRNVQVSNYWASSGEGGDVASVVDMVWSGYVLTVNKADANFVWPVRGVSRK